MAIHLQPLDRRPGRVYDVRGVGGVLDDQRVLQAELVRRQPLGLPLRNRNGTALCLSRNGGGDTHTAKRRRCGYNLQPLGLERHELDEFELLDPDDLKPAREPGFAAVLIRVPEVVDEAGRDQRQRRQRGELRLQPVGRHAAGRNASCLRRCTARTKEGQAGTVRRKRF